MSVLAFDLGASGGKAFVGHLTHGKLETTELHRFPNDPVQVGDRLYWDILRLFFEIKQGLLKAKHQGIQIHSIGIDSWAVDYGLLHPNGELINNPYHYRDSHTKGIMEQVRSIIPDDELFARSGLQFLPFNTLYQLYSMQQRDHSILQQADRMLMIPELLRYFLTGEQYSEYTNATTTQLVNAQTGCWDIELLEKLSIPTKLFNYIVEPGTRAGVLSSSICEELNISPIPVTAVAEHDTASAVAAVPANEKEFAYLSCGTWSLLGTEVKKPILSEQALQWNFTHEGGVNHTFRLLKNVMGLWILQECRRAWEKEGDSLSYGELITAANKTEAFQAFIDPDDESFLNPSDMLVAIANYCRQTNQSVPSTVGQFVRIVMESLAMKYRFVLERLEALTNTTYSKLHMVGGGIQNELLCQMTANAIGRPVWAGPIEASAIGNIAVQFISLGQIRTIQEARNVIRESYPIHEYKPQALQAWKAAYVNFCRVTGLL